MPTPTLGNALITRFTVVWSGNENMMDAETDNQPYKYKLPIEKEYVRMFVFIDTYWI